MEKIRFIPGKAPKAEDPLNRTIKFKNIVCKEVPPAPETDDVDVQVGGLDDHFMWMNDIYGDCVVADWCAHLLRDEKFEQNIQIEIPDADVKTEYFEQTGGTDSGLVMLYYLKHLRTDGIKIGDRTYKIHAFAEVDFHDHEEVKQAIHLLRGVYFGMLVPQSMIDQFNAGEMFSVVVGSPIKGGHAVYSPAYLHFNRVESVNEIGPVFRTWGTRVQATWAFWDKYVDECYAVIDEQDTWVPPESNPLDIPLLESILAEITGTPVPPPEPPTPPQPGCLTGPLGWLVKKLWRK